MTPVRLFLLPRAQAFSKAWGAEWSALALTLDVPEAYEELDGGPTAPLIGLCPVLADGMLGRSSIVKCPDAGHLVRCWRPNLPRYRAQSMQYSTYNYPWLRLPANVFATALTSRLCGSRPINHAACHIASARPHHIVAVRRRDESGHGAEPSSRNPVTPDKSSGRTPLPPPPRWESLPHGLPGCRGSHPPASIPCSATTFVNFKNFPITAKPSPALFFRGGLGRDTVPSVRSKRGGRVAGAGVLNAVSGLLEGFTKEQLLVVLGSAAPLACGPALPGGAGWRVGGPAGSECVILPRDFVPSCRPATWGR